MNQWLNSSLAMDNSSSFTTVPTGRKGVLMVTAACTLNGSGTLLKAHCGIFRGNSCSEEEDDDDEEYLFTNH